MDADQMRFKDFPPSLHTASSLLQIGKQSKTYAVCLSCSTLYNVTEVVAEEEFKCTHVEFPMKSMGKSCGMELTMQVPLTSGNKRRPKLLFPLPNLKIQINSLYQRPEFKQQLRKWTGRHVDNGMLADIYDGKIWNGIEISAAEKIIRLALICCSNDIPAARKLCGHISAPLSCHRCYKKANSNGNKLNFGGFDDMDDWFVERDLAEHRRNAEDWRLCKSQEERKRHVSSTFVRWTELLRLPYFNLIRHLIVDLMHCLFLRIAHWIIKKLWIENNKITKHDLEKMEKRAKNIKLPTDLGRLPSKVATRDRFSGFTADQWKSFILIYAIPLMWDLLDEPDRKILGNFVRACTLLVCRIIDDKILSEAHEHLLKVAMLIEENYGPERITPNLHLCLHIADCCQDYGPLYSFWCYSFERMNGILGRSL